MPERRPPAAERNLLWAASGGACAFPDCVAALVESVNGTWVTVGELAHIHAHSPGGARFDHQLPAAAVDSYDNSILLCRRHHRMVDASPDDFPAETLREWKRRHGGRVGPEPTAPPGVDRLAAAPPLAHVFVDRDDLHEQVASGLATSRSVVLVGAHGSGKSQLAVRYLHRSADGYTFRWWVRASSRETAASDVAALAPLLGLEPSADASRDQVARLVLDALEARPGWLLVFDDAQGPDDLLGLLPSDGGHILITTVNAGWSGVGAVLPMPPLSQAQAFALIALAAPTVGESEAAELAEACGLLPIAVAQATSYLAQTGAPAGSFLSLLRSERARVMERGTAAPHVTLAVSVDRTTAALTAGAAALLRVFALLAPVPFAARPTSRTTEDEADPLGCAMAMEDAIAELRSFSLVERDGDTVATHELIQEIVRMRMHRSLDEAVAAVRAIDAVYAQLPERTDAPDAWPAFEALAPHVEALRERMRAIEAVPGVAVAYLLNRIGPYYKARGQRTAGEAALREGLDLCGAEPVDEHGVGLRASLLNNLGNTLRDRGDLAAAADCVEESLLLKERMYGPDHPLVGITCGALAAVREATGDLDAAVALHERALRIHRLAGDDRRAAAALVDIAADELRRGDAAAAQAAAVEAAALAAAAPGAWIEEGRAQLTLAKIYEGQGRLDDALAAANAGHAAVQRPGIESVFLAAALAAQARILSQFGDPAALPLFQQALDVHRRTDPQGLATAQAQGDYGAALFFLGRVEDALEQLRASESWLAAHRPAGDHVLSRGRLMLAHALTRAGASGDAVRLLQAVAECATPQLADEARAALAALLDPT